MEPLTQILVGITSLFLVLLAAKNVTRKKFCVLCASIFLTWVLLLTLFFLGKFSDKTIIAILMGMSFLGFYYTWENKVKKKFLVFRLPLILTFIFLVYTVLNGLVLNGLYFTVGAWLFFTLVYLFKFNEFANKLVECCKKW